MRTILHILTQPQDELARTVISNQRALPETTIDVVELKDHDPDYDALVDKIFAAPSIQVW